MTEHPLLNEKVVNAFNCTSCLLKWNDGKPYIDQDGQHNEANETLADLLQIPVVRTSWRNQEPEGMIYEPENNRGLTEEDMNGSNR